MELISDETLLPYKDKKLKVNKQELLKYIEKTSNGKAVILLIDELNHLGFPIANDASRFLKDNFLDIENRYLVYSTHIPFDIEIDVDTLGNTRESSRGYLIVDSPTCFNINELRRMSDCCSSLTNAEMLIYGGIPSLIYSRKSQHAINPENRVDECTFDIPDYLSQKIFAKYIWTVLNGRIKQQDRHKYRVFDRFATLRLINDVKMLQWPLCYLGCVCGMNEFNNDAAYAIKNMIKKVELHAEDEKSGKDWEFIVNIAIALRCLDSSLNGTKGIFDLFDKEVSPDFKLLFLPPDYAKLESIYDYIIGILAETTKPNTIIQLVPSHSQFEVCDGLLLFKDANNEMRASGYQVKLGRGGINNDVFIPSWIDTVYIIQGNAPVNSSFKRSRDNKIIFLLEEEVFNLLGCSLASLHPSYWVKPEKLSEINNPVVNVDNLSSSISSSYDSNDIK